MITLILAALAASYLIFNIALVAFKNYRAHKFFAQRVPELPVVPNPSLFGGHLGKVIFIDKNCDKITDLHAEYGTNFGYYMCNQAWISTKDLDVVKKVFLDEASDHMDKTQLGIPVKEFNNSILTSGDETWRRSRRAISPALTNNKIRSDEVSDDIDSVVNRLQSTLEDKLIKMENQYGENMVDFNADVDPWVAWIDQGLKDANNPLVKLCMIFPFVRPLGERCLKFVAFGKTRARIMDFLEKTLAIYNKARSRHQLEERKMQETSRKSFSQVKAQGDFKRRMVDTVIDAFFEKKITREDLMSNMWAMIVAGYLTTSDTMTCLVWHLARNKKVQEKLRTAIMEEGIDSDYVTWCILETVRWHPAVPIGPGRTLGKDVKVNGQLYPKGSYLMPSIYSIHHDPDIWTDPDEFIPERWANKDSFHPAAFLGFGLGPRNCPGGKLAIHEVRLVLQMLMKNYKIDECSQTARHYKFSCPLLVFALLDQPIKVKLSPISRESALLY